MVWKIKDKKSCSGCSQVNTDFTCVIIEEHKMFINRVSQQGGLNETTSWRILWKDLALCTYKYK